VVGGGMAASGGATTGGSSGDTHVAAGGDGGVVVAPLGSNILTAGLWDDNLNFDFFSAYAASKGQLAGNPGFAASDYAASNTAFGQRAPRVAADIALVLDTTGSMGDELTYLTAEFANIWTAVATALPNADQHWALIVYRDTPTYDPGDAYVVRSFDFTTSATTYTTTLGQQSANGGGDYPESPELGLAALEQLSWRTDPSVARIAFWVADAPHHVQNAAAMKQSILDAQADGIRLYPVSASGADDLLELTMRSAAQITGGRYLFLTDDSGVGDPHKLPEIPCYFVTKLAKAIVRSVAMELTATAIGPDPADILRTVGNPTSDGQCTTQDGQTVHLL
jgi:hypothetical protein